MCSNNHSPHLIQDNARDLPRNGTMANDKLVPAPRVAIIGAGPVGLECAHYALKCGYTVRVFDSSDQVAAYMHSWRHIAMFSSWATLRSPLGASIVEARGYKLQSESLHPTAGELLDNYLVPLAAALPAKSLWLQHRVVGITRAYTMPDEATESLDQRAHRPFRIMTRNTATGEERAWSAEHVIDCTSGGRVPAWIGCGGLPALGEMGCTHKIWRHTPDISGSNRGEFSNRKTLLIGDGSSAAASATMLASLADVNPETSFFWAVAVGRELPCVTEKNPASGSSATLGPSLSPRRALLMSKANLLVKSAKPYLVYSPKTQVEELRYSLELKKFLVTLQVDRQTKRYQFDNVIANVGWRRDVSYLKHLRDGEAGFYEIGGVCRNADDALGIAHDEIRAAFRQITGNPGLDQYGGLSAAA